MQPVLVHRLRFKSYDHLFLTNTANSVPLFSRWRDTIGKLPAYDVRHWYDVRCIYEHRFRERLEEGNWNNVQKQTKLNAERQNE
jgi:hypothetical protein